MDKDRNQPFYRKYILLAFVLCLCFLATSLIFLFYMMQQNNQENVEYIKADANQKKMTIAKQVQGDIQTLEGIAVCIRDMALNNSEEMSSIMQEINNGNSFIRMGVADINGYVQLFNIGGNLNAPLNLGDEPFFRKALSGKSSISVTVEDPFSKGAYINYYAVPIKDEKKQVCKVLCAVNPADTLANIINSPIFRGAGFSNIMNQNGEFVIRAKGSAAQKKDARSLEDMGVFTEAQKRMLLNALKREKAVSFTYEEDGEEQLSVVEPIGINGWSITGAIPKAIIKQRYNQTAVGVSAIIFAALCIFLLLLYQQQRIMRRNEKSLRNLAYVDQLTGCSNFSKFLLDAEDFVLRTDQYAVWYCDLKNFKYFNDIFGYKAGDYVLQALARQFKKYEGKDFLFCRVSADNFTGIRAYESRTELEQWFEDLVGMGRIARSSVLEKDFVHLSMGFYCPLSEDEKLSINDMVNRANMAQNAVKQLPGNQYAFFTDEIRLQALKETEIEADGKIGINAGQFMAYFQPKVNIQKGNQIVGAEALARWQHPKKGMIPPDEFISVFEKTGLIDELDRHMFCKVCRWLHGYLAAGNPPISIAVNVSRLGLLKPDFIEYYTKIKDQYQIPDNLLELEFTESLALGDDDMFNNIVRTLQDQGFTCSLDDFGSGYSSLNVLKNLPVNVLKLDMLFFRESVDIKREQIVVSNIINMARELKIKTIAEGVENIETVDFLRSAGCDVVQGYIFSKPLPQNEFDRLIGELKDGAMPLCEE